MKTVFSTDAIRVRDRFDFWHEIVYKKILAHQAIPQSRNSFEAQLDAGYIADFELFMTQRSPVSVVHTKQQANHTSAEKIFLFRLMAGGLVVEQNGQESQLAPGDLLLLDPRLPYMARSRQDTRLLVIKVTRSALEARLGILHSLPIRSIKPGGGERRLASAFVAMLPDHTDTLGADAARLVRDQALDLVALRVRGRDGPQRRMHADIEVAAAAQVTQRRRSAADGSCPRCRRGGRHCGCQHPPRQRDARRGRHLDRPPDPHDASRPLPARAGGWVAEPSHDQRDCLRLGVFRHDAFRPDLSRRLWRAAQRVPPRSRDMPNLKPETRIIPARPGLRPRPAFDPWNAQRRALALAESRAKRLALTRLYWKLLPNKYANIEILAMQAAITAAVASPIVIRRRLRMTARRMDSRRRRVRSTASMGRRS